MLYWGSNTVSNSNYEYVSLVMYPGRNDNLQDIIIKRLVDVIVGVEGANDYFTQICHSMGLSQDKKTSVENIHQN